MKELWIGRIEVLTEAQESGDTRAFTNVVARAMDATGFRHSVGLVCNEYGWSLLAVEACNPASSIAEISNEELLEALERAEHYPAACIFTTLHYYPSKPA